MVWNEILRHHMSKCTCKYQHLICSGAFNLQIKEETMNDNWLSITVREILILVSETTAFVKHFVCRLHSICHIVTYIHISCLGTIYTYITWVPYIHILRITFYGLLDVQMHLDIWWSIFINFSSFHYKHL